MSCLRLTRYRRTLCLCSSLNGYCVTYSRCNASSSAVLLLVVIALISNLGHVLWQPLLCVLLVDNVGVTALQVKGK